MTKATLGLKYPFKTAMISSVKDLYEVFGAEFIKVQTSIEYRDVIIYL